MVKANEFIKEVYETIKEDIKGYDVYIKGENGVSNIVIFDEPDLVEGEKSRYRIAHSNIMIFNEDNPILAIETIPKESAPPRDIVGPIPLYMIARKVVINKKNKKNLEFNLDNNDSKFTLLVVVPDQREGRYKNLQILDLNEKFKGVLNLKSEYSNLKDFEICEFSNIKPVLSKLIID